MRRYSSNNSENLDARDTGGNEISGVARSVSEKDRQITQAGRCSTVRGTNRSAARSPPQARSQQHSSQISKRPIVAINDGIHQCVAKPRGLLRKTDATDDRDLPTGRGVVSKIHYWLIAVYRQARSWHRASHVWLHCVIHRRRRYLPRTFARASIPSANASHAPPPPPPPPLEEPPAGGGEVGAVTFIVA